MPLIPLPLLLPLPLRLLCRPLQVLLLLHPPPPIPSLIIILPPPPLPHPPHPSAPPPPPPHCSPSHLSVTAAAAVRSRCLQVSLEKLSQALYGIHHLNFSDPIVISVLSHLNDILCHSLPPPRLIKLTNRAFHRLFVSLRYLSLSDDKLILTFLQNISKFLQTIPQISSKAPLTFMTLSKSLIGLENMKSSTSEVQELIDSYVQLAQMNSSILQRFHATHSQVTHGAMIEMLSSSQFVEVSRCFKQLSTEERVVQDLLKTLILPQYLLLEVLEQSAGKRSAPPASAPASAAATVPSSAPAASASAGGVRVGSGAVAVGSNEMMTMKQLGSIVMNFKNFTYGETDFLDSLRSNGNGNGRGGGAEMERGDAVAMSDHLHPPPALATPDPDPSLIMKSLLQTLINRTEQSSLILKKYLSTPPPQDEEGRGVTSISMEDLPHELQNQLLNLEDLSKACYGLRLMSTTTVSSEEGHGQTRKRKMKLQQRQRQQNENEVMILLDRLCQSYLLSKQILSSSSPPPAAAASASVIAPLPSAASQSSSPAPAAATAPALVDHLQFPNLTIQQYVHKVYSNEYFLKYQLYSLSKILLGFGNLKTAQILSHPSLHETLKDVFTQIHSELKMYEAYLQQSSSATAYPTATSPPAVASSSAAPVPTAVAAVPVGTQLHALESVSSSSPEDQYHTRYTLKYLTYLYQSLRLFENTTLNLSLLQSKSPQLFQLINDTITLSQQLIPPQITQHSSLILRHPSSTLLSYTNTLSELRSHFQSSSSTSSSSSATARSQNPTSRSIECFHNLFFHGFECDILLVSYYPNWIPEDVIEMEMMEQRNQIKRERELRMKFQKEAEFAEEEMTDFDDLECLGISDGTLLHSSSSSSSNLSNSMNSLNSRKKNHPRLVSGDYYSQLPLNHHSSSSQSLRKDRNNNSSGSNSSSSRVSQHIQFRSFDEFLSNCRHKDRLYVMNIEIDGPYGENNISTLNRMHLRDLYFKQMHNVLIKRVKLSDSHKVPPIDLLYDEFQKLVSQV
jgi:hypothetical protein